MQPARSPITVSNADTTAKNQAGNAGTDELVSIAALVITTSGIVRSKWLTVWTGEHCLFVQNYKNDSDHGGKA